MRFHFFFRTALLFFSLQLYLIDYVHQEFPIKLAGAGDRVKREFWCLEGLGRLVKSCTVREVMLEMTAGGGKCAEAGLSRALEFGFGAECFTRAKQCKVEGRGKETNRVGHEETEGILGAGR